MFKFQDFRAKLSEIADPDSSGDVYQKIIVSKDPMYKWFFCSDRFEFLHHVYKYILNRPADPDSVVYLPILDRKFGKFFVFGCVGSSKEAQLGGGKKNKLLFPLYKSIVIFKSLHDKFLKLFDTMISRFNGDSDDMFYKKFEDEFRGSTEEVFDSLEKRYDRFIPVPNGIERAIDIGCGRCEFVKFLKKRGYTATGVDKNIIFVRDGLSESLDIRKSDVFKFLKKIDTNSISLISALHIIEHFDFEVFKKLIKEIHRVLKPGGCLILETPNARNIYVTAGDFYRDPTHIRPIFPDTLDFILRYYSFEGNYYFFNNQHEAIDGKDVYFNSFDDYQYVSRDYAWVGYKIKLSS